MALPAAQYNYGEITESRPGRVMVELHDEAILALSDVLDAIGAQDIETRFNETAAAMQAVTALYTMLDHVNGGELAANLGRIYSTVLANLGRISFTNDPSLASESVELLTPLRDAFDDLDRREHGEQENLDHARNIVSGARAMSLPTEASGA
ncbi:flagellar protein FliS [Pelagibius sp. Alg239-R121]|uniref:flagellar protein FliS n=1 Tax=Pelagibius sp. Alg239-R121 TaxID=2993448 RepID=UPI0024A73B55|nr:flagellar protein FliS [Pelagibius sp. Alg239-R121]